MKKADTFRALALVTPIAAAVAGRIILSVNAPLRVVGFVSFRSSLLPCAGVGTAGRDAEVHAVPVAQDRVHAEPAVAGLPFAGVFVVADDRNHLPGIDAVAAAEERGRFD